MRTRYLLMLAGALPAMLAAQPAFAQAKDGDQGEASARGSGDIVVTARKRQESVLKVPVVESVLTAETLANNNVVDIRGITQQVAGLNLGSNVLTVGTQISLRGVGTSSLDAGVEQSVSLNIDGLQLTQGATYSVGMFDMAQVEVLKGPQALFFGKNSPGGVISIRTADPGDELEVIARAQYGFEAKEKRGELIVSTPLGDTLGFRFAGMYSDDDGYFFNKATALPGTGARTPASNRYNYGDEYILRGTLVWKPIDAFRARLKVNHTRKQVTGGGAFYGSCPDGIGAPAQIPFINPNEDCKVDRTGYVVDVDPVAFPNVRNNGTPFMRYKTTFGTLEMDYDLSPGLSLASTTGYFKTRVDGLLNGVNSGFAGPTLIADNQFRRRDFTQEVRLQSDWTDQPLNFLIGAFYQNANVANRVYVGGNLAYFVNPAFTTLTAGINDVDIRTWSGFGQLRYKPVETLEIAAGVRYTDERRENDASSFTGFAGVPTPIALAKPVLRSKNWSPELTITYTPTDDFTVFGALKQGYKSGSFIMTVPASPGSDNSFGDERVRGGELGIKARLADRALNLTTAFYYYKYDNLQVGANEVAAGGLPVIRTINAGKSTVYGLDFEATYRPPSIDGLTARLAVNWNHARFTEFNNAPCSGGQTIAEGCNLIPTLVTDPAAIAAGQFVLEPGTGRRVKYNAQDLSGLPLPRAADWSVVAGFDYETPVSAGLKLGVGVNGQYSSKFLKNLGRRADFYQPSFVKLNANLSIGAQDDAWEVALIGNNLTNKFTAGNCTQFSGATGQIFASPVFGTPVRNGSGVDELVCIPDRGREVFLRLTFRPSGLGR